MFVQDHHPSGQSPEPVSPSYIGHSPEPVSLTGNDLTVEQLVRVAKLGARLFISHDAVHRINESRTTVERVIERGDIVYGLNTELGPLSALRFDVEFSELFQRQIIVGHTVAHGEVLDSTVVRAMIVARVNGICKGGAGVRLEVVQMLVDLLNAGVHPVVCWDGSIGQSDLSEMAQIASTLIGLGNVEYQGQLMPAMEALALTKIAPVALRAKEALALISANGLTLGLGALVLANARAVLKVFDIAAAMALEGFAANLSIIHPAASRMKPHAGHKRVSERLRKLLQGSNLQTSVKPRNLQDPLSFRCIPQVHGACGDAMEQVRFVFETELNSASDNPLVSTQDDLLLSVGNFDVTNIAISLDMLRIAFVHVLQMASERIQKQLWSHFSGLPTGLGQADMSARLIPLSRVCAALVSEAKSLADPVSLSYRSQVAEGIEDHASMAPYAVQRTWQLLKIATKVAAIEMIVSAKAIEMRGSEPRGQGTDKAYSLTANANLTASQFTDEIDRVVALITSDTLTRLVSEAVGGLEDEPSHNDSNVMGAGL
jgi:histidine ammonia-lyase